MSNYLAPNFRRLPFHIMRCVLKPTLRFHEKIVSIDDSNTKTLVNELKEFQDGKSRLIIAFRHPSKHDPAIFMHLIDNRVKKRAKKEGFKLNRLTHAHFVYGQWILTWTNRTGKWFLPGIGAIPVNNKSKDISGIKTIRELLVNGKFPIAIAPEGQVTYHNHKCGELESGIISMASWCKEDMLKKGLETPIKIMPITVKYDYGKNKKREILKLTTLLNKALGSDISTATRRIEAELFTLATINIAEEKYRDKFNVTLTDSFETEDRINSLCDSVLKLGEKYFNLPADGTFLNRILTLRESISRNMDIPELNVVLNHMEVADILEYIDPDYILDS
ncbi:MAG: hypothetical protein B6229_10155, partial [Spirochaetaceae bacterium 4572_7]